MYHIVLFFYFFVHKQKKKKKKSICCCCWIVDFCSFDLHIAGDNKLVDGID